MLAAGQWYVWHRSKEVKIRLYDIADIHEGNAGRADGKLQATCAEIRQDPHALWFGGGDWPEAVSIDDKRYDPQQSDMTKDEAAQPGLAQARRLVARFDGLAHKGIGVGAGNHDYHYMLSKEQNIAEMVADKLGLPYLGYSFFFDLICVRTPHAPREGIRLSRKRPPGGSACRVRIMAHHGASSASTPTGRAAVLVREARQFQANVVFSAHCHDAMALLIGQLGANDTCDDLKFSGCCAVMTGSFLQTYHNSTAAGYGERRMYAPAFLGASGIEIKPSLRQIRPILPWIEV